MPARCAECDSEGLYHAQIKHSRLIVTDMRVFAGLSRTFYAQYDQACSSSFVIRAMRT